VVLDKRLALLAPGEIFATPEAVRDSRDLTRDEKADILRQWSYDAAEMAVAVEEGMPEGDRNDLQRRILLALDALEVAVDLEQTSPTKQHGLTQARVRRGRARARPKA
jgi:hypothetical protein